MAYDVKIIADSVAESGHRLTTFQVQLPKWILAELNTHRMLSRNAASSRAIPIEKVIEQVQNDPVMPVYWGKNQPGMQAETELTGSERLMAEDAWLEARDKALGQVQYLSIVCKAHKQVVNRLLEPWMWATVVVSGTDWENFFRLRCDKHAQPEFGHVARKMRDLYDNSTPVLVPAGGWHMPFLRPEDNIASLSEGAIRSVARCARVSYNNHGKGSTYEEDERLFTRLSESGHWSPFEHVATPAPGRHGNFNGWRQMRQSFDKFNHPETYTESACTSSQP